MKVLYCTSEALPYIATGGLGDVAGSLPQALRQRLIGCRIVMPLYEDIPQHLRNLSPAFLFRLLGDVSIVVYLKQDTAVLFIIL